MDFLGPLFLECSDEALNSYVPQMLDAAKRGRWDAFVAADGGVKAIDDAPDPEVTDEPDVDIASFLAEYCPVLEGTHRRRRIRRGRSG
jgi:hypothetical protein